MRATLIVRALNRAVLAALAAPPLIACEGQAATNTTNDASDLTCLTSDAADVDVDLPTGCATLVAVAQDTDVCGENFPLVGPATACDPRATSDINTALPQGWCPTLCPAIIDDASVALRAVSCTVFGDAPGFEGGLLQCAYPNCCHIQVGGRRPVGLISKRFEGPGAGARFLAEQAYLEAASVDAFDRMTRELEKHGAPSRLRAASRRAARDEIHHARLMTKLAQRAGARVPEVQVEPSRARSLEEMAIENAVEGCVRETFGAAVAMLQAEGAADAQVRRAMRRIARDETRHAELSWAVGRWVDRHLDAAARRRVRDAQTSAVEALARETAREPDESLTGPLGLPSASQSRTVLEQLKATLWSAQRPASSSHNRSRRRSSDSHAPR
jgi:hypothetical protein